MADFFTDLGNSLTGQGKLDLSKQALDIQTQLAKDTLAVETESQKLKYNPELSKQRTIQLGMITGAAMLLVGIFIYIKFLR